MTLLQGIANIKQVAYGRTTDISGGFPFCRVYLGGIGGQWEDQVSFFAVYPFVIEIVQEIAAKTKAQAEIDLEDTVYQVIRTLVANWQISGNADDTEIQSSPAREIVTPQGPAVSMQITFNVKSLIF